MCVTQGTLQSSVYCSQHQSYSHAMMTRCALKSKVGLGTIVGLPGSHLKLLQHRKDRNYATSQRSTLSCHRHSTCERGNKIDRPFAITLRVSQILEARPQMYSMGSPCFCRTLIAGLVEL